MTTKTVKILVVNDDDLDCTKEERTLEDITIDKVGFSVSSLSSFQIVIYKGKLGKKVLRANV